MPSPFLSSSGRLAISLFPRGTTSNRSGIVVIDLPQRRLLAEFEFSATDLTINSRTGLPSPLRHARGVAVVDDVLFVSAFNAVNAYRLKQSGDSVALSRIQRYTHPLLCDIHGIAIDGDRLTCVSTGADGLIQWHLDAPANGTFLPLRPALLPAVLNYLEDNISGDGGNWRDSVPNYLHLNNVCPWGDDFLVTSLRSVWLFRPHNGAVRQLFYDSNAILHDGQINSGSFIFTDAAAGNIVILDLQSGSIESHHVIDPTAWFLRGLCIDDATVVVLGSMHVANQQLNLALIGDPPDSTLGCEFLVVRYDLCMHKAIDRCVLHTNYFRQGTVVYAASPVGTPLGNVLKSVGLQDVLVKEWAKGVY